MAHPQVAGEEMAFRYVESSECIEYVDGSLAWRLGGGITVAHHRKTVFYEMLHCASGCMFSNEYGIETSGLINNGEYLDRLSDS
jgi:hypothetical protein